MTISLVGSANQSNTSQTTFSLAVPDGAIGDLVTAHLVMRDNPAQLTSITGVNATAVGSTYSQDNSDAGLSAQGFFATATTGVQVTFTLVGTETDVNAIVMRFTPNNRRAFNANSFDANGGFNLETGGATTIEIPTITTANAAIAIACVVYDDSDVTHPFEDVTNYTELVDLSHAATTKRIYLGQAQGTAGAIAADDVNFGASKSKLTSHVFSFQEQASGRIIII